MRKSPRLAGLDAALSPHAVAIVGASQDPARIGGRPIRYYRDAGFSGALYPINPNRTEIQGLKAYPDLNDIPGRIDCVVVAVPPDGAHAALRAASAKGARAAIVFTANYAEAGAEGLARQEELTALGRDLGLRIIGPNCLGVFNADTGHAATFGSFLEGGIAPQGRIGVVSQSGAYASYLYVLLRQRRLGIARWVATGNESDVTVADVIGHFAGDDGVRVIAAYIEGVKDGPALLGAIEMARAAKKSVVLIKVGRSEAGAEAARSHTASLAGDDAVFDALVAEAGAIRVATTEALVDLVEGLERRGPLPGNRLGIVTISGGAGVLMADAAAEHGLVVPALPEAVQARLKAANPLGSFANPVDITAQAFNDVGLVGQAVEAVLAQAQVDAIAAFFMTWLASPVMGPRMRDTLSAAMKGFEDRTIALAVTAAGGTLEGYREAGMILNEDPSRVVATLGGMAAAGRALAKVLPADPDLSSVPILTGNETDEASAKAYLARAGLPMLNEVFARNIAEIAGKSQELSGKCALKIVSADLPHKSDVGGVALNLDPEAVEAAAATMLERVGAARPDAVIQGFLISEMAGYGVEMIVSARSDPVFGPVVMVGLGGVFVEVMKDVAFAAAPVDLDGAKAVIGRLKGKALLDGARGRPSVSLDALAQAIVNLSHVAAKNWGRFETIEINPLLVREHDAVMLDALVTFGAAHG